MLARFGDCALRFIRASKTASHGVSSSGKTVISGESHRLNTIGSSNRLANSSNLPSSMTRQLIIYMASGYPSDRNRFHSLAFSTGVPHSTYKIFISNDKNNKNSTMQWVVPMARTMQ
jgi:hypothetical protein